MKQSNNETQKETSKSTFRAALSNTLAFKRGLSMHLFWFAFLTIFSFCLAYIFPGSLIFTIPFIILPSFFSFLAMNSVKVMEKAGTVGFFIMFRTYFSAIFYGSFKLIKGIFKALLVYLLSATVLTGILSSVIFKNDSGYVELISKLESTNDASAIMEELELMLFSNESFSKWMFLVEIIALLMATILFLNHIGRNCPKLHFNLHTPQPIPMRQFNVIDKETKRHNRHAFFKEYCGATWFVHLLVTFGFAIGSLVEFFVFKSTDVGKAFILSLFISFLFLLIFMNYLSEVFRSVFIKFSPEYEKTIYDLTLNFINKYKDKVEIDDESMKKLNEMLKSKNKETNSEDNKDSSVDQKDK